MSPSITFAPNSDNLMINNRECAPRSPRPNNLPTQTATVAAAHNGTPSQASSFRIKLIFMW